MIAAEKISSKLLKFQKNSIECTKSIYKARQVFNNSTGYSGYQEEENIHLKIT